MQTETSFSSHNYNPTQEDFYYNLSFIFVVQAIISIGNDNVSSKCLTCSTSVCSYAFLDFYSNSCCSHSLPVSDVFTHFESIPLISFHISIHNLLSSFQPLPSLTSKLTVLVSATSVWYKITRSAQPLTMIIWLPHAQSNFPEMSSYGGRR